MKKIVNGKSYDTESAAEVCDLPCTAARSDFEWHDTTLYVSPRGQFFVAGMGGPASMWRTPAYGGGWNSGDGLRLVDADEARSIMERAGCDAADFARVGLPVDEG
ncbi:hypothetical protein [Azohydromonas sp.]|uniref:hypothetical protein n=1 Tax=Azohydromonas sp. TaxID=1872666 RepID=UPI002CDD475A|nr:hypothetical protein [Azohydromonas sp.]HMM87058.1 hypothetical protein [Azohydromonas sp.]